MNHAPISDECWFSMIRVTRYDLVILSTRWQDVSIDMTDDNIDMEDDLKMTVSL